MDRDSEVRMLVLNSMVDDFENLDQIIFPTVRSDGRLLGWEIERGEVVTHLAELVESGFVGAFRLASEPPHEIRLDRMPELQPDVDSKDIHFYPTAAGFQLHADWNPPSELLDE